MKFKKTFAVLICGLTMILAACSYNPVAKEMSLDEYKSALIDQFYEYTKANLTSSTSILEAMEEGGSIAEMKIKEAEEAHAKKLNIINAISELNPPNELQSLHTELLKALKEDYEGEDDVINAYISEGFVAALFASGESDYTTKIELASEVNEEIKSKIEEIKEAQQK